MRTQTSLIESMKRMFEGMSAETLKDISNVYSEDIVFVDPVQEIRGRDILHAHFLALTAGLTECRFEYLDEILTEKSGYLKWDMHFSHRSLGKKPITVRGMTQVQYVEKIHYHEDSYDLGAMIYEHVPILGTLAKLCKSRLSVKPRQ